MNNFGPFYIGVDPSGKCVRLDFVGTKLDLNPQTARELAAKIEEAAMCVEKNSRGNPLNGQMNVQRFNPYLEGENHGQTPRIEE